MAGRTGRVSELVISKLLFYYKSSPPSLLPPETISSFHRFSNFSSSPPTTRSNFYNEGERREDTHHHHPPPSPPNPIPNRPLRGEKRRVDLRYDNNNNIGLKQSLARRVGRTRENLSTKDDDDDDDDLFTSTSSSTSIDMEQEDMNPSRVPFLNNRIPMSKEEKRDDQSVASFLDKFNLNLDVENNQNNLFANKYIPTSTPQTPPETSSPLLGGGEEQVVPEDADEIFKKMKETGLIPNAVAMLDGLCKDGLVQEAMKLFGLMREKGTIPEVVIYTAVVEGFCKAQKLDDAKRIFRKMQNNGISPNAFSYTVLIQGLLGTNNTNKYRGGGGGGGGGGGKRRLEEALEFFVEMIEAGHSPNVMTFVSLVDGFVTDKGVEEATSLIGRLREKDFFVNDKAVREHLNKNGPFSSLVWEAIFGKKSSQKSF